MQAKFKLSSVVLYPNEGIAERVTDYSSKHSSPLPKYITDYHDHVEQTDRMHIYMISTFQAQNHIFLAHLIGAERILEIGVYVGFSSLVWSHAVGAKGKVTGLEFDPEYAKSAEKVFLENGVRNVEIIVGDALATLPTLKPSEPYDMIFIDAQKSGYPEYLRRILEMSRPGAENRLLRPGGLIVADNVLRMAIVVDDSDANPAAALMKMRGEGKGSEQGPSWDIACLREYNSMVAGEPRLETFLMPLWDGVSISRLLD